MRPVVEEPYCELCVLQTLTANKTAIVVERNAHQRCIHHSLVVRVSCLPVLLWLLSALEALLVAAYTMSI